MALLAIGNGKRVGDWDIIGSGRSTYQIRRRDKITETDTDDWTIVGEASTPDAALKGLEILINLEYQWFGVGSRE